MKAVILAGGFGTRLSEAMAFSSKPMVEIGSKPRRDLAWGEDWMPWHWAAKQLLSEVTEGMLLQFGQRADDPTRTQIKVMMRS